MVGGVPLHARTVGGYEPVHGAKHGPALIKQVSPDLVGISLNLFRQEWQNLRQDRQICVRLKRRDHSVEDRLHQVAQHILLPAGRSDFDVDGERCRGINYRHEDLDLPGQNWERSRISAAASLSSCLDGATAELIN